MIPFEQLRTLSRYNRWMNERLYERCASLADAERRRDRGAFFGSIHGTLNHLLLGDLLWLGRFRGDPYPVTSLDQELHADFEALRAARRQLDGDIERFVEGLRDADLEAPHVFESVVNRREHHFPLWFTLTHFFNHQTHHRGQLTTLMSQAGCDPGVTDLLWLPGAELSDGVRP